MILKGLHHFNLIVSDMAKTKEFYHERLGLEIALETKIEDDEFSRGVGLQGTKVLATFFAIPGNTGLIETFQYVHPPGRARPRFHRSLKPAQRIAFYNVGPFRPWQVSLG